MLHAVTDSDVCFCCFFFLGKCCVRSVLYIIRCCISFGVVYCLCSWIVAPHKYYRNISLLGYFSRVLDLPFLDSSRLISKDHVTFHLQTTPVIYTFHIELTFAGLYKFGPEPFQTTIIGE